MRETVVDTPIMVGPGKSYIKAEPLGVVCVMAAWNYPYYTLLGPVAQSIAAGNCVVIKPSELSPNCSMGMTKVCEKYLDSKFFKVIQGKGEVAKKLTSMKFDMFCFTGSTQKGKLVAEAAGRNLVPCVLELGGKSPAIIDESADATLAAKKVLFGKMPNLGQVCIAPDYIMCHESKVEEFIASLKNNLENAYGNCEKPDDSGKMINEFHYNRLCDMFENHGGEVVIGNPKTFEDRNLKPSLILNPSKSSKMMQEEIFGPLFPMHTYKHLDEALEYITTEQDKPLVCYYFGAKNGSNMYKVRDNTSSGTFVCNETIYQILNTDLPFGGVGGSGYGRTHGLQGF
jgi:aldehyde dehydrogenase (NAD+)